MLLDAQPTFAIREHCPRARASNGRPVTATGGHGVPPMPWRGDGSVRGDQPRAALVQMEHFLELDHRLVGVGAADPFEVRRHELLPLGVDASPRRLFRIR
jgi:hypothetical protein